jgi:ubiquinone/menaquinone biosynthesis C-methylase UbiE
VKEFPGPAALGRIFEDVGFSDVGWKLLWGGIAALHWGVA